jgi:hypothetical protein
MNNTYDILLNPPPQQPPNAGKNHAAPLRLNQQKKDKKEESDAVINQPISQENPIPVRKSNKQASKPDGAPDVITSCFPAVNLKAWQEVIENTETQNSALRLTSAERYAIEDVVSELRRTYGIKTSMNELARLGLLVLRHDFQQQKKASLIHQVKKA